MTYGSSGDLSSTAKVPYGGFATQKSIMKLFQKLLSYTVSSQSYQTHPTYDPTFAQGEVVVILEQDPLDSNKWSLIFDKKHVKGVTLDHSRVKLEVLWICQRDTNNTSIVNFNSKMKSQVFWNAFPPKDHIYTKSDTTDTYRNMKETEEYVRQHVQAGTADTEETFNFVICPYVQIDGQDSYLWSLSSILMKGPLWTEYPLRQPPV